MDKIDVVILWVDGNDPAWLAEYNKYAPVKKDVENSTNRYREWDNLKYIFRGIEKFCPWVNNVHLVTWGHLPQWLNTDYDKLKIHTHKDIFRNAEHLPVFNASAIELNISGINQLSEKFIYFNDDCFILKSLPPERFFRDDKPVDFLVESLPRRGWLYEKIRKNNTWASMINNSVDAINKRFSKIELRNKDKDCFFSKSYDFSDRFMNLLFSVTNKYVAFQHYHLPMPYCKKTFDYVWKEFYELVNKTSASRFRDHSNVSQALVRYSHLAKGEFFPQKYHDYNVYTITDRKSLTNMLCDINDYAIVCINDEVKNSEDDFAYIRDEVNAYLNSIMPEVCAYEKDSRGFNVK